MITNIYHSLMSRIYYRLWLANRNSYNFHMSRIHQWRIVNY